MSVSLICPACGAEIGEASHEDNYKIKYYNYRNNIPICKNCSSGSAGCDNFSLFVFVFITILISSILSCLL